MPVFIIALLLAGHSANEYSDFYERISADAREGKPIVVTIYVALCDAEHQGVVIDKYPNMCTGSPKKNLYWTTKGGLKGYLDGQGWTRELYEEPPAGAIAVRGIWRKRFSSGTALRHRGAPDFFDFRVIGLAYRGLAIEQAVGDFLSAVGTDSGITVAGVEPSIEEGGSSHVVGFLGHNYLLDVSDQGRLTAKAMGEVKRDKGAFVLACLSDEYLQATARPALLP